MQTIKVYLDSITGNDEEGIIGDSIVPFKNLDVMYSKLRGQYDPGLYKLNFYANKGVQRLNLGEYVNCYINGIDNITIGGSTVLTDVKIEGKITIELPTVTKDIPFITTKGTVEVVEYSTFKVVEAVPNTKISYPDIVLILNQGDLKIDTKPTVEVNRKFTLVKNDAVLRMLFPDVQYQGGDLFIGTSDAKSTLVLGNNATSDVKVSAGRVPGYLGSYKVPNNFSLGHFDNGAVFNNVKVTIRIPMLPELLSQMLFVIPTEGVKSGKELLGAFNYNLNEGLLLQNCNFSLEAPLGVMLPLCNSTLITKVNTSLKGIVFNKESQLIAKITGHVTLDDSFSQRYHIDAPDGTVITIPDELDISSNELYFRKLNSNKLHIKTKKFHGLPAMLTLDQSKTQVILYKHEGFYYTKNLL